MQEFYYSKQDVENLQKMDDHFHIMLYSLSKRHVIYDTLRPLHRKTQRYRKLSLSVDERSTNSHMEHKKILAAIAAGDAELASKLTTQHIRNAKENMIARFDYHG